VVLNDDLYFFHLLYFKCANMLHVTTCFLIYDWEFIYWVSYGDDQKICDACVNLLRNGSDGAVGFCLSTICRGWSDGGAFAVAPAYESFSFGFDLCESCPLLRGAGGDLYFESVLLWTTSSSIGTTLNNSCTFLIGSL